MILETALADALYLNWAVPVAALPPAPLGLRYDLGALDGGESSAFFSLVLFRQVGLHVRGASWLALSYPQVNACLYVRDAANTPSVLLLRQLVPGWVVPIGRLVGGQPLSAAVCEFPEGLPREPSGGRPGGGPAESREWRWKFSAGARFQAAASLGAPDGHGISRVRSVQEWEAEVAFFRDRRRAFWRQGEGLRRSENEPAVSAALPVRARLEEAAWLDTFLAFAPAAGWSQVHSAFLVSKVQMVFAFDTARELPVAAPMAAAG